MIIQPFRVIRNLKPTGNHQTQLRRSCRNPTQKQNGRRAEIRLIRPRFDSEIKQAETKQKANPKDETLKKSLAEAYVKRGIALTDARQYASALGDYRRALKLDPTNEEAKKWIEQIISIYESINRSYPSEGEEPPPLPFKKES